jgi:hypothetical protein
MIQLNFNYKLSALLRTLHIYYYDDNHRLSHATLIEISPYPLTLFY